MISSDNNSAANSNNAAQINANNDGKASNNNTSAAPASGRPGGHQPPMNYGDMQQRQQQQQQQQMYGYPGGQPMYVPGMTPQHGYYPPQQFMPVISIQQPMHPNSPQLSGQEMGNSPGSHGQSQQQRGKKKGTGQQQPGQPQGGPQQGGYPGGQQAYGAQYPPQNFAQYPHMYQQAPVMQYYAQQGVNQNPVSQPVREKKILEIRNPHTNEMITPSPMKPVTTADSSQKENTSQAPAEKKSTPTPTVTESQQPVVDARAEMLARTKAILENDKKEAEKKKVEETGTEKGKAEGKAEEARKSREEEAQKKMMEKAKEAAAMKQKLEEEAKIEERKRKEREAKKRMEEMELKRKQAQEAEQAKAKAAAVAEKQEEKPPVAAAPEAKKASAFSSNVERKVNDKTGKITYSVIELVSFKERCKEVPPSLSPDKIDMINIISLGRSNSGRNNFGMNRQGSSGSMGGHMHRQNSGGSMRNMHNMQQGGAGGQWSRGSRPQQQRPNQNQMHPNQRQHSNRGGMRPGGPIHVPTMKVEPIKKSENAWKPNQNVDEEQKYLRSVTQILNKLSRENFDKLTRQMLGFKVTSVKMLEGLINLIRGKALTEPKFGDLYADLCKVLVDTTGIKKELPRDKQYKWGFVKIEEQDGKYFWTASAQPEDEDYLKGPFDTEEAAEKNATKATELRRILLNQCQEEFEQEDKYAQLDAKKKGFEEQLKTLKGDEAKKIKMEIAEVDYRANRLKQRILGNIQFIGELFKKQILSARVMSYCITHLIGQNEDVVSAPDEENVECLCKLLITVGKELASKPDQEQFVDSIFSVLHSYTQDKKLDSRHRFMCADVIDLRSNKWVPRRKELKAKTKEEVRKDALEEEAQKQHEANQANARMQNQNRGGYRNNMRRDNRNMGPGGSALGSVATSNRMGTGYKLGQGAPRGPGGRMGGNQGGYQPGGQRQALGGGQRPGMSMRPGGAGNRASGPGGFSRPGGSFRPGGGGNRMGLKAPPAARPPAHDNNNAPPAASRPKMERSELVQKLKETLKEYVQIQMKDELIGYLRELQTKVPNTNEMKSTLIEECCNFVIEKGAEERRHVPRAVSILLSEKWLTPMMVVNAINAYAEFLPDIKVDAPLADKHIGNFLAELIMDNHVKVESLPKCFEKLFDDEYNMNVAVGAIGVTLGALAKDSKGKAMIEKSGLELTAFFNGKASKEQLAKMVSDNQLDSIFSA